jgi:glyoxylase-like metal-dependent hydrolase (beta-lactamase superfamily II)
LEGVRIFQVDNIVTRAVTAIGGGYDYSVCFLIEDQMIIDTGYPWAARSLRKILRRLELEGKIKCVVNTHEHEDHTGNNHVFVELGGATVYAHPLAIPLIRQVTREVFREKTWANTASFGEGWLSILTASDFSRTHLVASFLKPGVEIERAQLTRR